MKTVEQIQREVKRLGYTAEETFDAGAWDVTARFNGGGGHAVLVTALKRAEAWHVMLATVKNHVHKPEKPESVVPITESFAAPKH